MDTKAPLRPPLRGVKYKIRQPNGMVGEVVLHVDHEGAIVRVMNGALLENLIVSGRKTQARHLEQVMPDAAVVPGITLIHNADGSVTPVVSDKTKRDMSLFVEEVPCWFEGCAQLRQKYEVELAAAESDPNCPPCLKGALIRKYLKRMSKIDTSGQLS